jgi:hypothetical protein
MPLFRRLCVLFAVLIFSTAIPLRAAGLSLAFLPDLRVMPVPVPQELRSFEYSVQVNGKPIDVAHAAASYDYVNIEAATSIRITITANEDGFWDHGVDVQPWRLGIRPTRNGRTIEFQIKDPVKLAI